MKDFPNLGKIQSSRLVRKSPFSARKNGFRLFVTWGLLFLVAAFFVGQRIEFLRTERRIRALMEQKRQLMADILPLQLEESHLTRIGRIEGLSQKMGLGPAEAWQKFYLVSPEVPSEEAVEAAEAEAPKAETPMPEGSKAAKKAIQTTPVEAK